MQSNFYKITVGGVSKVASKERAMNLADELVKAAGGGIPDIKPCDEHGNLLTANPVIEKEEEPIDVPVRPALSLVVSKPEPVYSDWSKPIIDDSAKTRIEGLHAAIEKAGGPKIDTTQQFFETGTRLAAEGYSTQRGREREHFAKALLVDAIQELHSKVMFESRFDEKMSAKDIGKALEVEDGEVFMGDYLLTERAIRGIVMRLESPAVGYLIGLRERNAKADPDMLAEILHYECVHNPDVEFKMRMRKDPADVYAALSPGYAVADAPQVLKQIVDKMPKGARGSWAYDQEQTKWSIQANILTPTPAEEQAVGEVFEMFVELKSSDNGTARFMGAGGMNILRCLNASTYSAKASDISRVHRGDIVLDIKAMIEASVKSAHILVKAWADNREERIEIPTGLTLSEAIPGYFRFLLNDKKSELQGVLTGRTEQHVALLTKTFHSERRNEKELVRADFAQGFTRYIKDQPLAIRQEGESAIGKWVVTQNPMRCELKDKE